MADFEEKLNAILSDPKAMGQIMSIARTLTGEEAGQAAPPQQPGEEMPEPEENMEHPAPQALPFPGDLDPKLVQTALQLLATYHAQDSRKTALLEALRPFLRKERQAKMDQAIQIARLSRVARAAFQMLKGDEEGV